MESSMLMDLLDLSHVPRWITFPVARPQSVAEHSFRVAVIVYDICRYMCVDYQYMLTALLWALSHDGPESKTGDLPRPLKRIIGRDKLRILELEVCPWVIALEPIEESEEQLIVEIADSIEALSWLTRYGVGIKDKYDGEDVCRKLEKTIQGLILRADQLWPGAGIGKAAVRTMQKMGLAATE